MIAIINTNNPLEVASLKKFAATQNVNIIWFENVEDLEALEDALLYRAMTEDATDEVIPIEDVENMLKAKINASRSNKTVL